MNRRKLPPKIDTSPEKIAAAMFRPAAPEMTEKEYACASCGSELSYPDTLHDDGRCGRCHD